jgi:hypothetical protein
LWEVPVDRQLVRLEQADLDDFAAIGDDGSLNVDATLIASRISDELQLIPVRAALSASDYLEHDDGTPEPGTRSATGIWWHPHGDDAATIGGFVIEGLAMTITTEGEGESPVAESVEVIDRATKAICTQHEGGEVVGPGLIEVPGPTGRKRARVVVTRDHRARRPQDLLDADELAAYGVDELGFVIVQLIGGDKALVVTQGV